MLGGIVLINKLQNRLLPMSIIIYLGGDGPSDFPINIDRSTISKIIAADSGIELAQKHGVKVDCLIGDMDSASEEAITTAENDGVEIILFNKDKDLTDFELAIEEAKKHEADELIIIGGGGLRTDHLLSNLSVLAGDKTLDYRVEAYFENEKVAVCRKDQTCELDVEVGTIFSLVPINGNASGVTSTGTKWDLANATLSPSNALGISNTAINNKVTVQIMGGTLLIFQQIQDKQLTRFVK